MMKRLLTRILICLLLGAVVNVAVAWGLAQQSTPRDVTWWYIVHDPDEQSLLGTLDVAACLQAGLDRVFVRGSARRKNPAPGSTIADFFFSLDQPEMPERDVALVWQAWVGPELDMPVEGIVPKHIAHVISPAMLRHCTWIAQNSQWFESYEMRSGWPMRSMGASWTIGTPINSGSIRDESGMFRIPDGWVRQMIGLRSKLPVAPLWPGFIANTLIYGATFWIVLVAPFALRRITRMRRGHCINCAYDLRGTAHERCPECGAPPPASRTMTP